MRIRLLIAIALGAVVAGLAAQAGSAARPKITLCGQIKHGPQVTYTTLITRKRISGSTWTVFATGVPCAKAMAAAPVILRWWRTAKIEASSGHIAGFEFCNKESDGRGSAGSAGCIYKGLANIELIMTGPYSISQLKQMFGGR